MAHFCGQSEDMNDGSLDSRTLIKTNNKVGSQYNFTKMHALSMEKNLCADNTFSYARVRNMWLLPHCHDILNIAFYNQAQRTWNRNLCCERAFHHDNEPFSAVWLKLNSSRQIRFMPHSCLTLANENMLLQLGFNSVIKCINAGVTAVLCFRSVPMSRRFLHQNNCAEQLTCSVAKSLIT